MSIYSGFATRRQEEAYDSLVVDLITVLQRRIIKFYLGQETDEQKFNSVLEHLQEYLRKMELNKYQQPKLSQTLTPLLQITASLAQQNLQLENPTTSSHPDKIIEQPGYSFSLSKKSVPLLTSQIVSGKIRHQSLLKRTQAKEYGPDPETGFSSDFKPESFEYVPANYRRRKWAQRETRQQKKRASAKNNLEYLIRQYIGSSKIGKLIPKKDGSS